MRSLAEEGGGILFGPLSRLFGAHDARTLVPILEDEVGTELIFRISSRVHTSADAKTRGALQQIEQILASFPDE